mmetsp:Transcript_7840/g.17555  ORF Transcript_7840/g.17555 Transcript_7840/m.17555 type:complete len:86 (-) Transcript_7840:78-335(-)
MDADRDLISMVVICNVLHIYEEARIQFLRLHPSAPVRFHRSHRVESKAKVNQTNKSSGEMEDRSARSARDGGDGEDHLISKKPIL